MTEHSVWLPFPPLTAERLRQVLSYEPSTGIFMWSAGLKSKKAAALVGKPAGCPNACGYHVIRIDKRLYQASRLAWLWTYGRWPIAKIDHINGSNNDNRITNLREASRIQNVANTRRPHDNLSGFKGVSWHAGDKKWRARVGRKWLGNYDTKEVAAEACRQAREAAYGEFARS